MMFRGSYAVLIPLLFLVGSVSAAESSVSIRLDAQLWTRPLGKDSQLKFRKLGDGMAFDHRLRESGQVAKVVRRIEASPISATVTFLLVPATTREPAYVVTQVRMFDAATKGLIAECADYDSIQAEAAPGVGVCSGVIGRNQFGLTLSKAPPRR